MVKAVNDRAIAFRTGRGRASVGLAVGRRRQKRCVEDVVGLRHRRLEAVGQCDLIDRLVEPFRVDAAEPVGLDLRGEDVVTQREL